jgi:hypothetical protein
MIKVYKISKSVYLSSELNKKTNYVWNSMCI